MSAIHDHNRRAWDSRAKNKERFARPAPDEQFSDPFKQVDPRGWLGDIAGKRVLCLAAGGGRQSALYAAAGAMVTVVDISPEMLAAGPRRSPRSAAWTSAPSRPRWTISPPCPPPASTS